MDAKALASVQEGHTNCKRADLLEKIQANREQHVSDYNKAIVGWRKEFARVVSEHAESCKALADKATSDAKAETISFEYPDLPVKPENHSKDYDRIIARLEMSQDESIYLKNSDFYKYVMDEWSWKGAFTEALSNYAR